MFIRGHVLLAVALAPLLAATAGCFTVTSDTTILAEWPVVELTTCRITSATSTQGIVVALEGVAGGTRVHRDVDGVSGWLVLDAAPALPPGLARAGPIVVVRDGATPRPGSLVWHVSRDGSIDPAPSALTTDDARESFVLSLVRRDDLLGTRSDWSIRLTDPGGATLVASEVEGFHRDPSTGGVVAFFALLPVTLLLDLATSPLQLPYWVYRLAS
jgi:hypothetical protein